jgi:hypothetical protein
MERRRFEDRLFERKARALDIKGLVEHIDRLESEVAALTARLARAETEPPDAHLLFFATPDGYQVAEVDAPPPLVGQVLLLERGCFRVLPVGRSPFPRDRRPCVFLEAELLLG